MLSETAVWPNAVRLDGILNDNLTMRKSIRVTYEAHATLGVVAEVSKNADIDSNGCDIERVRAREIPYIVDIDIDFVVPSLSDAHAAGTLRGRQSGVHEQAR